MFAKLKRVAEIAGLLASFLLIIGLIRLFTYYQNYNINIVPYLDFSEIVLSIFSDIIVIYKLLIFIVFYVGSFSIAIFIISATDYFRHLSNKAKAYKQNKEIKKLRFSETLTAQYKEITTKKSSVKLRWIFGALGIVILFVIIIYIPKMLIGNERLDVYGLFVSSALDIVGLFFLSLGIFNQFYKAWGIAILIGTILVAVNLGNFGPDQAKQKAYTESWTFVTEKDTITTSNTIYLVGKTNNFYFLYNEKEDATDIIPAIDIKRAQVKEIKNR